MAGNSNDLASIFDPRFTPDMTIAQRMHLVMTRADYIQKEKKDGMKYTIVSHDAVTALVRQHTVACGVIYYVLGGSLQNERDGNMTTVKLTVRFESIHNRDDFIDVDGLGYGIDPQDKGPGKAISYAVKYALLKAFGLETGDDPDYDQDTQRRSSTQDRAAEFELLMSQATDEDALRLIVTSPNAKAIREALMRESKAEFQRLNSVVAQNAKRVGLDLSTL